MSLKKEAKGSQTRRSSLGIKILNDEKVIAPLPVEIQVMTSVPLSPPKQITLSIAKPKKELKQKNMDHYVMKTVKGEKNTDNGIEESETIDFILTENNEDESLKPGGEITEELHLSEDEDHGPILTSSDLVEHVCGKCFTTFRRLKSLKKHLDYCRFDSGYSIRKAEMLKNLDKIEKDAVIMENKDVCFCCGESYDTFHLGHINCPDCPKSFKTQMSYERHIFITHSEDDFYPCSICNAKLRSANLLKLHEEQHRNRGKPFACKICGKDFTRSYHLSRHQKYSSCSANENDTMNCKVCNRAFYRLDNLRQHLKQHLGTQQTKKSEYMCPICKKCFYSLSTLNIHTRTHTGERPFDCDLCEKKFPSLVALKKHRRYHTGEKPYTCSVCKQSFAVKEVLNRHMKRHTGERPHVCTECGKSFIQGTQLRTHAKTHLRPHACNQCPEKFKTEKQLEKHIKEHSTLLKRRGRTPMSNKCDICKIGFKTEIQFNEHMQIGRHLTPAQRRRLKTRTDCAVCKENFESVQSLQFHILKVHQEDPETFVNEDSILMAAQRRRLKTRTDCAVCKENFESVQSLQFHILKVHQEDPETFVNEDHFETPIHIENNDSILMPAPKVIKIEDSQGARIEFVTTNSDGKILNTNVKRLNQEQEVSPERKVSEANKVRILDQYIFDESPTTSLSAGGKQTIFLSNEAYTVIPLESDGGLIEPITTTVLPNNVVSPECKKEQRKSLAESLAAAIADDGENVSNTFEMPQYSEEDFKIKDNVSKLLDMLVDSTTLKKFGWPSTSEESVLCKVIENCGHDLSKDQYNYASWDYASRMREYVKLLFTVVIHNDSIKELLNNYPIDEVIEYVLGNDEDDDDDDEEDNANEIKENDNKPLIKAIKCESGD